MFQENLQPISARSARWRSWWENWWFYHKNHAIIGIVAALILAYFAWQTASSVPIDYTVAWVSSRELDSDEANIISEQIARYGKDLNDDGKVHVSLHQIQLDLRALAERGNTEGEKERGQLMALEADMAVCQSVLYLTDDPEALWSYTGVLLYKDGTQPSRDASDWENMVIPWKLPAALDDNDMPVYLGCRGCWEQDQKESWDLSRKLWNRILENTEETKV